MLNIWEGCKMKIAIDKDGFMIHRTREEKIEELIDRIGFLLHKVFDNSEYTNQSITEILEKQKIYIESLSDEDLNDYWFKKLHVGEEDKYET